MSTRNTIARDLLMPLPREAFALGSVEALDAFLASNPLPEATSANIWDDYRQHCRQILDALSPGWPSGDTDYLPDGAGFIELWEGGHAAVRGMLDRYDPLLADPETCFLNWRDPSAG